MAAKKIINAVSTKVGWNKYERIIFHKYVEALDWIGRFPKIETIGIAKKVVRAVRWEGRSLPCMVVSTDDSKTIKLVEL